LKIASSISLIDKVFLPSALKDDHALIDEDESIFWASLNFHEFVSNPQPLGFTRVAGQKPVHTPPPL